MTHLSDEQLGKDYLRNLPLGRWHSEGGQQTYEELYRQLVKAGIFWADALIILARAYSVASLNELLSMRPNVDKSAVSEAEYEYALLGIEHDARSYRESGWEPLGKLAVATGYLGESNVLWRKRRT